MNFLNYREISHTTNFGPLLELGKSLGASYLSDIQVSGNAHYTSEHIMQEMVQCLGDTVLNPIYWMILKIKPHSSKGCQMAIP